MLLNSTLTVRSGEAASHAGHGWEVFTDEVIRLLSSRDNPIVFVLWGAYALKKRSYIDETKNKVIHSSHPSPLSVYRGFSGSKPFSKINNTLSTWGQQIIKWECSDDGNQLPSTIHSSQEIPQGN